MASTASTVSTASTASTASSSPPGSFKVGRLPREQPRRQRRPRRQATLHAESHQVPRVGGVNSVNRIKQPSRASPSLTPAKRDSHQPRHQRRHAALQRVTKWSKVPRVPRKTAVAYRGVNVVNGVKQPSRVTKFRACHARQPRR